jgi:Invasin, domain 3
MRTLASIIAVFFISLALSGCGGDSGCGHVTGTTSTGGASGAVCGSGSGGGGGTTTNVASLAVSSSSASIPADGSSTATITVLAKDANNNAMSGVAVTLAASAGTLSGAAATTAADGTISAQLSAAGVAAGQAITITATSGSVSGKATINVVANQQTLTLLTNSPQMPSNNSKPATITALIQGANNQLLAGVPVVFQASSGAIVAVQTTAGAGAQVPAGTSDANGVAQATLSNPNDPTNRTITVTATAGSTTATIQVAVVGTAITVSGPANLVQGGTAAYNVLLVDSGNAGIANQSVTVTSANGNTVPATVTTDTTGQATINLTATKSGNDTLTVAALGLQKSQAIAVSNQNFTITAPADKATIAVGQSQPVTVAWTSSGAPQAGTITFAASRGTLSANSAALDTSGNLTPPVTITSTTAGPAIISATASGVAAQSSVNFVATVPASVSVQASPSAIATQGQSTIIATVTDGPNGTGNPVQGATVDFTLTDTTGGALSAPNALTNAQGQATLTYTASTGASTPNGVQIKVVVENAASVPAATTTLTVGGQTVSLASLGSGRDIINYSLTQYALPYTVQAVDASGKGVGNIQISFSVKSVGYLEGFHYWNGKNFWDTAWTTTAADPLAFLGVQGVDGCQPVTVWMLNGQIYPTNPPANAQKTDIPGLVVSTAELGPPTVTVQQSSTTGSDGTASVSLIYPKDHAYYVAVALTATATVQGTQNSTTAVFWIPGSTDDFGTNNIIPPGPTSPYGSGTIQSAGPPPTVNTTSCYQSVP